MNTTTKRELRAWARAFGLVAVILTTAALLVLAGLATVSM